MEPKPLTLEDLCSSFIATGELDLKGLGTWAPTRGPAEDDAGWGRWEAWEDCKMVERPELGVVRPEPTGGWVAWDSATGQQLGFNNQLHKTARQQAEMMAVLQNDGAPTRVVPHQGGVVASDLDLTAVRAEVEAAIARMTAPAA